MKKIIVILLMLICVVGSIFINLDYNNVSSEQLAFVDMKWSREGDGDTEFIGFNSDGTYYYYCACGNPVNDSDVCETYTYDNRTKTIRLKCFEDIKGTITEIEVISVNDKSLVLDFNGDIRTFEYVIEE